VNAIEAGGGHEITAMHVATDHSWSDRRIALESTIRSSRLSCEGRSRNLPTDQELHGRFFMAQ